MSVICGPRQAQPLLHRQQEHSERFLRAASEQVHDEGKEHERDEKTSAAARPPSRATCRTSLVRLDARELRHRLAKCQPSCELDCGRRIVACIFGCQRGHLAGVLGWDADARLSRRPR